MGFTIVVNLFADEALCYALVVEGRVFKDVFKRVLDHEVEVGTEKLGWKALAAFVNILNV